MEMRAGSSTRAIHYIFILIYIKYQTLNTRELLFTTYLITIQNFKIDFYGPIKYSKFKHSIKKKNKSHLDSLCSSHKLRLKTDYV